jgi:hypothetical protein
MLLTRKAVLCCVLIAVASACASTPIVRTADVPPGSEIVVIPFRDCLITGQDEDCNGSGLKAGEAFQEVFSTGKFRSTLATRPVSAKESLTDQAAVDFARRNGHAYIINGEVDDFYSVAAMTFRSDRAAISMRLLRASDGQAIITFSKPGTAESNFATPKGMIKDLAVQVRNAL